MQAVLGEEVQPDGGLRLHIRLPRRRFDELFRDSGFIPELQADARQVA